MSYHLTLEGPKRCTASVRACPLGGAHFDTKMAAQSAYEVRLKDELGSFKKIIDLPCAFGIMKVMDGDLSNFQARNALISGLCGDLAKAIQNKYGGDSYFVCYGVNSEAELEQLWREGKFLDAVTHALIESKEKPGEFMDAYGRETTADLEDFYGDDIKVIKVSPEMLQSYTTGAVEKLSNFADSVLSLDARNESYPYDFWDD